MIYKRSLAVVLLVVLSFNFFIFFGCDGCSAVKTNTKDEEEFIPYPSVNFIDVGYGESIFILFSDGKSMLVDCGKDAGDGEKVVDYLKRFKVTTIDYLVLTHPDTEHVGGAEKVIEEFSVKKAYTPKFTSGEEELFSLFPLFNQTIKKLDENGVERVRSKCGENIIGEDYTVLFLSPRVDSNEYNSYRQFAMTDSPTASQIDNLSPMIYLDMDGVRFLFAGDAGKTQEKAVLENAKVGFYKKFAENLGVRVDLEGVDFLKLSSGGFDTATSEDFANYIAPKNAVAFLGDGRYADAITLNNLWHANQEYELYKTDDYGNISVKIDGEGLYSIITDDKKND